MARAGILCVTAILTGFASPTLALESWGHPPVLKWWHWATVTRSTGSSAVPLLETHVQSEHQLAHRHGCALWSSVESPIRRERAQQKRDFHCCKFCPDLLPNFLSSHPKCYKRRETLCLISSFFAHMKGMGSDGKLAAEQLSVETTTASVFGPPALWWPLFLPPVWAGAVVCANSRTSSVPLLKPQQVA